MKVVVRADASIEIGSGHIMRCLTLAERLRQDGATVVFLCRELTGNMCKFLSERKFDVSILNDRSRRESGDLRHGEDENSRSRYLGWLGVSQMDDALEAKKALTCLGFVPDWLVVDHYSLGANWEREMRPSARGIMVIDDLADRPHECDILLDQNLCADYGTRYSGLVPATCVTLLGPRYALLRPEFREARRVRRERGQTPKRILVFFGGSDPQNVTDVALRAIGSLGSSDLQVDVVIGSSSVSRRAVEELCRNMPSCNCHVQPTNMASLMAATDLFVGAGGTTTWERMMLGLPSVVVAIAENQVPIASYLGEMGFLSFVGQFDESDRDGWQARLRKAILDVFSEYPRTLESARVGKSLIDGEGVARVTARMAECPRN